MNKHPIIKPPVDWGGIFALFAVSVWILFVLGFFGTIAYVAVHFILKFW